MKNILLILLLVAGFSVNAQNHKGKVTSTSKYTSLSSGGSINFDTYNQSADLWGLGNNYLYVQNSHDDSMSTLIYDAMPN